MNDDHDPDLLQVREAMRKGEVKKAISILSDMMSDPERRSAAAYTLGIVYDCETELADSNLAKEYYSIAETYGYELATYRIAGILQREGNLSDALTRFKEIHTTNPSAAYWCYRIAVSNPTLLNEFEDYRKYLSEAARNGHILAKRDDIFKRLKGRDGVLDIFVAAISFVRLFFQARAAVASKNKMLYQ